MKITLKHFATLLNYIAVWFVVRAIWNWFFATHSSIISAVLWFVLFFISHLLEKRVNPIYDTDGNRIKTNIPKAIIVSLLFLFGIALVVWGFQYFFNNPYASLIMIPVWYLISFLIYPIKKNLHPVTRWKIIPLWLIISGLLYVVINWIVHTIPSNWYNISSTWSMIHTDYTVWTQETTKWVNNLWGLTDGKFEWGFLHDIFDKNKLNNDINITWSEVTRPTWMDGYDDQDIYTHCVSMPSMEWCENFLSSYTWTTTLPDEIIEPSIPMDHSSMINSEFDFLALMIPHHQEAVDSSASLLKLPSISPQLKPLLENIISSQNTEIRSMLWWLNGRYSWVAYTWEPYMPMMRDVSNISDISVVENIYIQDMISHHQWATQMAEKVLTLSGLHEEVKSLANNIIKNQSAEINVFESLLTNTNTSTTTQSNTMMMQQNNTISPDDQTVTNTIYPWDR